MLIFLLVVTQWLYIQANICILSSVYTYQCPFQNYDSCHCFGGFLCNLWAQFTYTFVLSSCLPSLSETSIKSYIILTSQVGLCFVSIQRLKHFLLCTPPVMAYFGLTKKNNVSLKRGKCQKYELRNTWEKDHHCFAAALFCSYQGSCISSPTARAAGDRSQGDPATLRSLCRC